MPDPSVTEAPRLTCLGKIAVLLFIVGCLAGGGWLLLGRFAGTTGPSAAGGRKDPAPAGDHPAPSTPGGPAVTINLAYGTEKERWLRWAVERFAQTKEGAGININLLPYGSLEGAQAALAGDQQITAWSPASSLYQETFVRDWQDRYGQPAIVRAEPLALTPMVFVLWAERYDAFVKKYGRVDFETLARALAEPGGWDAIAQKPEWGVFKFGHTHPNESNSGLMTLVLMAYDWTKKDRDLSLKDILDPGFQQWMTGFERGVSGLSNSTGNMMKEMVLKGPSSYDGLCVYESVAIDYLKSAEGRWGELRVAYPAHNLWSDSPYYVLNASWSSPAQRRAAGRFLDFLLSVPIQKEALTHGFRPANPDVPVRFPESPLVTYARYGLRADAPVQAEPPKAEVINNLLAIWQRTRGSR